MSPFSCTRERELTDLLDRGAWPSASPAELKAHVRACRICSDLLLVKGTLQAARRQSTEIAPRVPPGAVWWRAQLRRRNAAIEKVTKPILGAQLFATAIAVVVAIAALVSQADNLRAWIEDLPRALHLDALIPASFANSGEALWIVVPVLAMIGLLSGLLVYLATEKQ